MPLSNAAAARVRLIVSCKECQHQVEPNPAESSCSVRRPKRPALGPVRRIALSDVVYEDRWGPDLPGSVATANRACAVLINAFSESRRIRAPWTGLSWPHRCDNALCSRL